MTPSDAPKKIYLQWNPEDVPDVRFADAHEVSWCQDRINKTDLEYVSKTDRDKLAAELKAYREGGVTEEILRRNDGYIKVGRGCVIVREDEWKMLGDRVKEVEADNAALLDEVERLKERLAAMDIEP